MPARRSTKCPKQIRRLFLAQTNDFFFLLFSSVVGRCVNAPPSIRAAEKNGRKTTNHQSTRQETNASKMIVYAHKKCKSKLLVINQKALNLSLLRVFTPSILYHFLQQFQRNIQPLKECSK